MDAAATICGMDIRHKKSNKKVKISVHIDLFLRWKQCYNIFKIGTVPQINNKGDANYGLSILEL